MARAACFSRRQFHRLMLQVLGETPGTHQRRVRLDRAAWLLLTSRTTVLDVALDTGFENHETFTRPFERGSGDASVFRKNRGKILPDQYASCFPQHFTHIMAKKTGSITSALTALLLKSPSHRRSYGKRLQTKSNLVAKRFLRHRFTATDDLELKPADGSRRFRQWQCLVWYQVIALNARTQSRCQGSSRRLSVPPTSLSTSLFG